MPRRKGNPRTLLIEKCDKLMYQILCYERGERCELCGATHTKLGLFHILPKGRYPRIRFNKFNLLIAGWFCCHLYFHHDFYIARDRIVPRIKALRGDDYEEKLQALDMGSPVLSTTYLQVLYKALVKELKQLERGWQHGVVAKE